METFFNYLNRILSDPINSFSSVVQFAFDHLQMSGGGGGGGEAGEGSPNSSVSLGSG